MKLCAGGYIKHGTLALTLSHEPIVFDEATTKTGDCPLCYEKAWHEATAQTLRATEEEVGKHKALVVELGGSHLLD